jgi:hypothetical protein
MAIIALKQLPKFYRDYEALHHINKLIREYFENYRKGDTNEYGDPILSVWDLVILNSGDSHYIFNITVKNNEWDDADEHLLTQEEMDTIHKDLENLLDIKDYEEVFYVDNSMNTITCTDTANPYQFLNITVLFEYDFLEGESEKYYLDTLHDHE